MANDGAATTDWARRFVSDLVRGGLTDVCIAPGSRSTPLTMAFAAQSGVNVHMHMDERSAAFFALGIALATKRAAALVCTSGSAGANYHPAIIEAYQSAVPMVILTADRPHELRYSGANQTIDQVKMFADHVLWSADMALPETNAPAVAIRNVQTMAMRALATANGLRSGPVHLNFPLRKPLEPAGDPQSRSKTAWTQYQLGRLAPSIQQINELYPLITKCERGIIVCGPGCPDGDFRPAVAELASVTGYPIFADPLSGLRFDPMTAPEDVPLITGYETFLAGGRDPGWAEPEVILRFGAVPTSKWLNDYLSKLETAHRYHFRANGMWADDTHLTRHFWQVDETYVCHAMADPFIDDIPPRHDSGWCRQLLATEAACQVALEAELATTWFDGAAVRDLVLMLPNKANLVMGNSLPIRHLDQFGSRREGQIEIYGNRGASGIDGNVSTALGVAAVSQTRTVLVTGDITFYHDMNGLYALRQLSTPVVIVLLNNDGGGIFRRLPISAFEPEFTPHFVTPHGLDFSHAAAMYGLTFHRVTERQAFNDALAEAFAGSSHTLIELQTDGQNDETIRKEIVAAVNDS